MPLLEYMDKIMDGLNSQMGSCRGPLSEYRTLLVEQGDLQGSVAGPFHRTLPSARMNIFYMKTLLLTLYCLIFFQRTFYILHDFIGSLTFNLREIIY